MTLNNHKKIKITHELYQAIQTQAQQNSQTVDQYAQYLLEKALTKGDPAQGANRSH